MGESADLFDIVSTYFIEEGYDKKDVYAVMSSVDLSEEVQDIHEVIPLIGAALAGAGKLAAGLGAKAVAGKALAGKALSAATGGVAKGGLGRTITRAGIKLGGKTGGKIGRTIAKNPATSYMVARDMTSGSGSGKQPIERKTSTISASADLFDIVKGQLIDEGLSEEEIKDIMLTLTPDEIMSEMAVNPNIAAMDAKNKADMIARAQANKVPDKVREASKRQMKAGTPREDKNNPYTTQDKKTIIDYNKNK